jgi:amino acid adenylation domain-containing protein
VLKTLSNDLYSRVQLWNSTSRQYPHEAGLAELFERRCNISPDACAIVDGARRWSYAELAQHAEAVTQALTDRGIAPTDRVGIVGRRSIEAVAAIVGVIKAGAVYVPLDTAHPRSRLQSMAADAGIRAVIALPGEDEIIDGVVVLRPSGPATDRGPVPIRAATGEDLAQILFTSGSTGRPKAVGVRQRGIVRLVCNTDYVRFAATDRVLHTSALSFDLANFEIWGALLNGACLVISQPGLQFSPESLRRVIDDHSVNVMLLSTGVFHSLARQQPSVFAGVRDVLVCGEVLSLGAAQDVLASHPPPRLHNAYGPTENTAFTTTYLVNDLAPGAVAVPIGRPIANTTCYIVKDDGTLADVGEQGELLTGGDGVALGYLNDPAMTAQRFVPDPFVADTSARLYRTGDIASWQSNGVIDFHGRCDDQIKIHGHRVEPAETEDTLCAHPLIAESAVIARSVTSGDEIQLVAYLTHAGDASEPSTDELRFYLSERLPRHMIPAQFCWLDRLPLTPHGKVDRTSLAAIHTPALNTSAPQPTPIMEQIGAIWHDVLHMRGVDPKIRPDDTLFAVGGESSDAPLIHARVTESFEVPELTILDLFTYPTLRGYTDHLIRLTGAEEP